MKKAIQDVVNFFLNLWTIIWTWLKKYGIQNMGLIGLSFYFWFVSNGSFWSFWGTVIFGYFIGRNVEAIKRIWSDLKKDLDL